MADRSWRWLRARILGLLSTPVLGYHDVPAGKNTTRAEPLWATRLQAALHTTGG